VTDRSQTQPNAMTRRMKYFVWRQLALILQCAGLFVATLTATGQIDPASVATEWTPVTFGEKNYPDTAGDQASGGGVGDIVGDESHPSFFMRYADGFLGFRLRLGADQEGSFQGAAYIGLDANMDGAVDLFLGVNHQGDERTMGLWQPGGKGDTSPSTTVISSPVFLGVKETDANFNFRDVNPKDDPSADFADLNGDGLKDQFLTVIFLLGDINKVLDAGGIKGLSEGSTVQLIAATASNENLLDLDLNGVKGGLDSEASWSELGAMSQPVTLTPDITVVPEPSIQALLSIAGGLAVLHLRKRLRRD